MSGTASNSDLVQNVHCTHALDGVTRPLGKIVCIGRNYADHAAEMGAPAERGNAPMLFLKPSTALVQQARDADECLVHLPAWSIDVHHEVEMVLRMGVRAHNVTVEASDIGKYVDAWGVGLDLTARDVQAAAKAKGHPWSVAKGFDESAPLSMLRCDAVPDGDTVIKLEVNSAPRQNGALKQMLWSVPELISFISTRFTLEPGDLIFTGTPAGVSALTLGDVVTASCGAAALRVRVVG